jgi:hypothetical protein
VTYLKVLNISNNGLIDYKGLDIDSFIPNSQVYTHDFDECILKTQEGELLINNSIIELTEEEYIILKQEILSSYPTPQPTAEEQVLQLKAENENLKQSMQSVNADLQAFMDFYFANNPM